MPAGRFAPSPTSELHLGNLRTALLAWLFARRDGLDFVVRVEDLDQQRVAAAPALADQQLRDLEAIGLDWDGEVVRQSQRLDLYRDAAASQENYRCFCTRREIVEASQAPNQDGYRPYPGTCRTLTTRQAAELGRQRPAALRVAAGGATCTVHDRHAGAVTATVDDFVLFRNDHPIGEGMAGTPSYNLAVVVDDGLQEVTQVVRGSDLLSCAPRQGWLAQRLGFRVPEYAHVGLALNELGQRLAKRDGAVSLSQLRATGVDAAAVLRLLCESCGFGAHDDAPALLRAVHRGEVELENARIWEAWTVQPAAQA